MACIENWMEKAEENSKNINNLHAQKNRKGSALITQKKQSTNGNSGTWDKSKPCKNMCIWRLKIRDE